MKKVIFLDFDGVLNGKNLFAQDYYGIEDAWEYEKQLRESSEENGMDLVSIEKQMNEICGKINNFTTYISEPAIERLAQICKETGASVVLNGTQSQPLYDKDALVEKNYILPDRTNLLDSMRSYGIPIEEGFAYDIRNHENYIGANCKLIAACDYLLEHPDIDDFIILEDTDVIYRAKQIERYVERAPKYAPILENISYETHQIEPRNGLNEEIKNTTISRLLEEPKFDLKAAIEKINNNNSLEV